MAAPLPTYEPVKGKTYSLFGNCRDTSSYYRLIRSIADDLLLENELHPLLALVRKAGRENTLLRSLSGGKRGDKLMHQLLAPHQLKLKEYVEDVSAHLRGVKLQEGFKSVLWTTENQYYLYMLEIELANRMNIEAFNGRSRRFALLPHCLRDIWGDCKAGLLDYDLVCRHCNADCYVNHLSRILKENRIEPYLWTSRNLKSLFREFTAAGEPFGVLGIACIPELVMGLRRSERYGVPAVGIPLNANNCMRWRGSYMPSSVDLGQLERLVSSHS